MIAEQLSHAGTSLAESSTAVRSTDDLQLAHHPLSLARPGNFLCTEIDDSLLSPARMNSLGICVGRPLELVSTGDPMIVRVSGTAVGLSKQLAATVLVTEQPTTVTV